MIIICYRWWLPKAILAVTIFPFIFLRKRDKYPSVTINHEMIHVAQQKEMLVVFAYLWYWVEFIIKLVYYRNLIKAYTAVSFEREAYNNDWDMSYTYRRKRYSFIKYVYTKHNKRG